MIAYGSVNGKRRALDACEGALSSFRAAVGTTMKPPRLHFRLIGSESLLLKEVNDVKETIEGSLSPTSEVSFGVARDVGLKNEVGITLIGTLEYGPKLRRNRRTVLVCLAWCRHSMVGVGKVNFFAGKYDEVIADLSEAVGSQFMRIASGKTKGELYV